MATDDEILAMLREIRDIQQQHLEMYRAQSERAISISAVAVKRQRIVLIFLIVFVCVAACYVASGPDKLSQWKAIQDRTQQQLDQSDRQWNREMDARQAK